MYSQEEIRKRGLITSGFHLPYNPNIMEQAKELRKNMTKAEKKLWYCYLKDFNYKVYRQRPIDNYIVDFYCHKLKLVIELDGGVHFTKEAKDYDNYRTSILKCYDLKIIRFKNEEVLNNFEKVCKILNQL